MPQTSLLDFLGIGPLPVKSRSALLGKPEAELTPNLLSAKSRETHQSPEKSANSIKFTALYDASRKFKPALDLGDHVNNEETSVWPDGREDPKPGQDDPSRATSDLSGKSSYPTAEITFALPHVPSITITLIRTDHLPALKRLTRALLPIRYPDTLFNQVINDPAAAMISRVALSAVEATSASIPVGWICCSLEPYPEIISPPHTIGPISNQIYIKALCLQAPYRSMGIATALLDSVLQQQDVLKRHNIQFIFAHVWESKEEVLDWYKKRGFEQQTLVEGYYRKLRPSGAWLVKKDMSG